MTDLQTGSQVPSATPDSTQLIWDFPLRLFHWSMVLAVGTAAVTGYFFEDALLDVHAYAGYLLAYLLVFRLIWGFVGSYFSRFHSLALSPSLAVKHLKNLLRGKSHAYAGHNPLGAWMIVALLIMLVLTVITGFIVWGAEENRGPLAALVSHRLADWSEEIHEALSGILMIAIGIHVVGVATETLLFKHPLIKAMITGKKTVPYRTGKTVSMWHTWLGFTILISIGYGVIYVINASP